MEDAGCLELFVPVDISEEITHQTAASLVAEYPELSVSGLVCDFEQDLELIPEAENGRLIAFLGGTIGNLYPDPRREFLSRIAALLGPDDRLLLGTDLVKDTARLEAAYNDSAGVTAEFNKNVLAVLNRELGADFDLDAFEHVARFDEDEAWMDIGLRSNVDQTVRIDGLDLTVRFAAGERMRTEISAKFTRERLEDDLPRGRPRDERLVHRPGRRLRAQPGSGLLEAAPAVDQRFVEPWTATMSRRVDGRGRRSSCWALSGGRVAVLESRRDLEAVGLTRCIHRAPDRGPAVHRALRGISRALDPSPLVNGPSASIRSPAGRAGDSISTGSVTPLDEGIEPLHRRARRR